MNFQEEVQKFIQEHFQNTLPTIALDLVIFGFHENQLKVLLLRWKGGDYWMLPGGRVYKKEDVDDAATRILRERTKLEMLFLQQFHVFGKLNRSSYFSAQETYKLLGIENLYSPDFRDVSVGYYALVEYTKVNPVADNFSDECRWWSIDELPCLLFDHNDIIRVALKTLRRQLSYQPVGYNLLPEIFSMTDLQSLYETILGRQLDRRNFYKQMMTYGILELSESSPKIASRKTPYLYRFKKERYEQLLDDEELTIG
ncbi:NUDIX hydrolase [Runella limosa]|uniref:NUDIX hydrolase n=1 Tax=Runella limosa TaxID=370978 RepID=UPI0003FFBD32|nr:NUDIX domain-containing protein [Runella limosa]